MNQPLQLTHEIYRPSTILSDTALGLSLSRGHLVTAAFATRSPVPPSALFPDLPFVVVGESHRSGTREVVLDMRDTQALVSITTGDKDTYVNITAASRIIVEALWDDIRAKIPVKADVIVPMMWNMTANGPDNDENELDPVYWEDIKRNYPSPTANSVQKLMDITDPSTASGRLILWHGPAGTGKTTALTSLMTQWNNWCNAHVVTDPEMFFSDPGYMMQVARRQGIPAVDSPLPSLDEPYAKKWKIIICEDADEYIRSDARQRSGAALGRLLNLTDGLLGRGMGTFVLLTTNDDIGRLHPAVTRPGRCLAAVEFPTFKPEEAELWLPTGIKPPKSEKTLAELYAMTGEESDDQTTLYTGQYL